MRLLKIYTMMALYRLDTGLPWNKRSLPIKLLFRLHPAYWMGQASGSLGLRLRLACQDLGPIFVKFGQILATRRDVIDEDMAKELMQLLDQVPAFDGHVAIDIVEKAYQQPIQAIFPQFDAHPLACASIAQVHRASLPTGEEVVVKIRRPGIRKRIKKDIALMYTLARFVERFGRLTFRLQPKALVAECERCLMNELDFTQEAANASQLKRNFEASRQLYVPKIYWEYSRSHVMVIERIDGIRIDQVAQIKAQGISCRALAESVIQLFFTQVLRDSFFHADMHPGNIFVGKDPLKQPHIILVDFGIMGSLSLTDQRYLAENMLAFFDRDYSRVAQLHIQSGWIPPDTSVEHFASAMRAVCEPIFAKPLKDISFGQLLLRLIQTARHFNMQIQPQLLLLQKTLLHVEGLGRLLYPELNLWTTAKPCIEQWLKKQTSVGRALKKIRTQLPQWIEQFPEMPELIYQRLSQETKPPVPSQKLPLKKGCCAPFLWGSGCTLAVLSLLHGYVYTDQRVTMGLMVMGWILLTLGVYHKQS